MKDDEVTFEPLDKLDILKEEMSKTFKGMDENLDKLQSLQEPIANAKPRMRSRMDELTQGVLDIRPFVPKSFTLFHGIADILQAIEAPRNAQAAREVKEADRNRLFRQSESIINRNNAYAEFLSNWKMPPEAATSFAMSGAAQALSQTFSQPPSMESLARPPGPASAVVTPPYAGVLAGGHSGASASGGTELRDILAVLREILELMRKSKSQGEEESEDESETVENRRPFFKKQEPERPKMEVKETPKPLEPEPSVTRPPQQSAADSISTLAQLARAAQALAAL